mmetsp:Transcript_13603/g.25546  ORF Transcript_13603/g.25546 Transcript_13603/m.25546 type:complete len:217 (+) Transcript_13603:39-689(+)
MQRRCSTREEKKADGICSSSSSPSKFTIHTWILSLDISGFQSQDGARISTRLYGGCDHTCQRPHTSITVQSGISTDRFRHLSDFLHGLRVHIKVKRRSQPRFIFEPTVKIIHGIVFLFGQQYSGSVRIFRQTLKGDPCLDEPISHLFAFFFRQIFRMRIGMVGHGNLQEFPFHILVQRSLWHGQDLEWIFLASFLLACFALIEIISNWNPHRHLLW